MSSAEQAFPHDNHDNSQHRRAPQLQLFEGVDDVAQHDVEDATADVVDTVRGPWSDQSAVPQPPTEEIDSLAAFEEAAARALGEATATNRSGRPTRRRQLQRPQLNVVHPPVEFDENEFVRQAGALAELLQSKLAIDESHLRDSVESEWSGLQESHQQLVHERQSLNAELQQQRYHADEAQRKQALLVQQMQSAWDTERKRIEQRHLDQLTEQRDEFELLLRQQQRRLDRRDDLQNRVNVLQRAVGETAEELGFGQEELDQLGTTDPSFLRDRLQAKRREYEVKFAELEARQQKFQREHATWQHEKSKEADYLARERETFQTELTRQVEDLMEQRRGSKQEVERLESRVQGLRELEAKRHELDQTEAQLEREHDQLAGEQAAFEEARNRAREDMEQEREQLNEQLEELTATRRLVADEEAAVGRDREGLQQQVEELTARQSQFESTKSDLEAEQQRLEADQQRLAADQQRLIEQRDELRATTEWLKSEQRELKTQQDAFDLNVTEKRQQLAGETERLESARRKFEREHETNRTLINTERRELDDQRRTIIDEADQRATQTDAEIGQKIDQFEQDIRVRRDEWAVEQADWETRRDVWNREQAEWKARSDEHVAKLDQMRADVEAELVESRQDLEKEAQSTHANIKAAREALKLDQQELDAAKTVIADRAQELELARHQLDDERADFEEQVKQREHEIEVQAAKTKSELEDIRHELEEQRSEFELSVEGRQQQLEAELNERRASLETELDRDRESLTDELKQARSTLSDQLQQDREAFDAQLENDRAKLAKELAETRADFQSEMDQVQVDFATTRRQREVDLKLREEAFEHQLHAKRERLAEEQKQLLATFRAEEVRLEDWQRKLDQETHEFQERQQRVFNELETRAAQAKHREAQATRLQILLDQRERALDRDRSQAEKEVTRLETQLHWERSKFQETREQWESERSAHRDQIRTYRELLAGDGGDSQDGDWLNPSGGRSATQLAVASQGSARSAVALSGTTRMRSLQAEEDQIVEMRLDVESDGDSTTEQPKFFRRVFSELSKAMGRSDR